MRIAAAALAAIVLAGCGAEGETTGDGGDAAPAAPATSLEVTVWPDGRDNGPEEVTTLECDPVGGDHPAPEEACVLLAGNPDLLEPVPEDVMCTQQFGGPEQAAIHGTFQGEDVDLSYSRANGCEIARWERLAPVFQVDEA
jgi:hypothetical protein